MRFFGHFRAKKCTLQSADEIIRDRILVGAALTGFRLLSLWERSGEGWRRLQFALTPALSQREREFCFRLCGRASKATG